MGGQGSEGMTNDIKICCPRSSLGSLFAVTSIVLLAPTRTQSFIGWGDTVQTKSGIGCDEP